MASFKEKQLEDWIVEHWDVECHDMLFPYMPSSSMTSEIGYRANKIIQNSQAVSICEN